MTVATNSPAIPAHPNLVEVVALLEDPGIRAKDRNNLRRVLHDTVHLVKKKDGSVQRLATSTDQTGGV